MFVDLFIRNWLYTSMSVSVCCVVIDTLTNKIEFMIYLKSKCQLKTVKSLFEIQVITNIHAEYFVWIRETGKPNMRTYSYMRIAKYKNSILK